MKFAILILAILSLFVIFSNIIISVIPPIVKSGDVWIVSYGEGNPFEQPEYDTLYILECKGEWMKYRQGEYIRSAKKRMLKGEKRIRRNQYLLNNYGNK